MPSSKRIGSLAAFAEARGLRRGTGEELPRTGALLDRGDLVIDGAVHGELAPGETGVLFQSTYTTRSDDRTTTHEQTAVVVRVPESIGYAPYIACGSGPVGLRPSRAIEPGPGVRARVDEGMDEGWITELFSPAFTEWLERSPGDFAWELADGVLTVLRDGHISDERTLASLCEDAARIAAAVREESLEEVESGGGAVASAKAPTRDEAIAARLVPELKEGRPAHVESRIGEARQRVERMASVWGSALRTTILWMIGINVIGGGIYGLLLSVGDPLVNVLIYQAILLVLVGTLVVRSKTSGIAERASEEAFYAGYAEAHDLRQVEPLRFAAEHAEAGLPAKPVRVFEGLFGGVPGHLLLTGNGRERGHQIALVRGPKGPTAVADLDVSAPGISAAALDELTATLLLDLETAPARVG